MFVTLATAAKAEVIARLWWLDLHQEVALSPEAAWIPQVDISLVIDRHHGILIIPMMSRKSE